MDVNFISALMQLGGKKSSGLRLFKANQVQKILLDICATGMNQDALLKLAATINPNIRPLATVITKLNKNEVKVSKGDCVQYNNFRNLYK